MPRNLWLGEDNTLCMAPVSELNLLRYNEKQWKNVQVDADTTKKIDGIIGDSCEIEVTIAPDSTAKRVGLRVRTSPDKKETTLLYYDAEPKKLCFDARKSGIGGQRGLALEQAPFELEKGEPLVLCVFIDKSVIEVFANKRQAIGRRVFPARDDSLQVQLYTQGGSAMYSSIKAWEMMPSNPY